MKLLIVSHGGHGGQWVLGTHGVPNTQNMDKFYRWAARKYAQRGRIGIEPKQADKSWGRYGYDPVPAAAGARQP